MKKWSRFIPDGTEDYIFGDARQKRSVEHSMMDAFFAMGYQEIITPTMEYFDVFDSVGTTKPQELHQFFDAKGRALTLRFDMTTPIARVAATRLASQKTPIKLCYNQNVFRRCDRLSGKRDEITQCGVEMLGESGVNADAQVIICAITALLAAGQRGFKLELGHVGFFKALTESLQIEAAEIESIRLSIERKNFALLAALTENIKGDGVKALKRLPWLFGSTEVLKEAEALAPKGTATEILSYLKELTGILSSAGYGEYITIDLGMVHHIGYYTGLIFRGYLECSGESCLAGGRYDGLCKNFGEAMQAVGFAITVDSILSAGCKKTAKAPLRIALTKGRLEEKTVTALEKMGIDTTPLKNKGRKLIFSLENGKYEVVLAKAPDVLTYVEHGVCDVGIVGKDTIMEQGGSFYEVLDLGFGKCRFAVAAPKGTDIYSGHSKKIIATKYPAVTAQYFGSRGTDVEVIKIEGSVELAPLVELADAIVDIVETGATLKENGLEIIEEVCPISARMIVNIAAMKQKKDAVCALERGLRQQTEDKSC